MIYVASSWRNEHHQWVVAELHDAGHDVYDFRNPAPGNRGFHWSEIDPRWRMWDVGSFVSALKHPVADAGFAADMEALRAADTTVLVLPCGRSAHLELGYAVGAGQRTAVFSPEPVEPELMYKMVDLVTGDFAALLEWLAL